MKILVQAHPSAREVRVMEIEPNTFGVWVTEPPVKGQANMGIIRALAMHFKIAPSQIQILSGHASRRKLVEIFGLD